MYDQQGEGPRILTVGELNTVIKAAFHDLFPTIWVSGEVTDLARPRSGHIYFGLKDDVGQIRAVMWRTNASRLSFEFQDGMQVICQGELDVYVPRGTYQLIVKQIEPQGIGALQLALRQLQARLEAEGLFAAARKRPLPRFPRRIAVVTSPSGAAIRDFLEVARRRSRAVDILIVPTVVQGAAAAEQIVRAIEQTKRLVPLPDALLVTRGGGSLEDLWCFNDERVVRAIHASPMPVVSAVGHEIDVTLADLVADRRALTPSEAGELLIPASDELQNSLSVLERRMRSQLRARFSGAQARLEMIARRRLFQDPYLLLRDAERRLDELLARGEKAVRRSRDSAGQQLAAAAAQLHSLSPLAVLERGYSVTQTATGELATVNSVSLGQLLRTRVRDGEIASRVEGIRPSEPLG